MEETLKYLKETLGVEIVIKPLKKALQNKFPLFMRQIYGFYRTRLWNRNIILLEHKGRETATADKLRKHTKMVEQTLDEPVVLVFPFLEPYNRKRLIQKQVAFIVPGKQMFIPQLLIDLKDFRNAVPAKNVKLLPAAQCILFYHLLKENIESFPLKTVAQKLGYTQATVTRAVQALVEKEIVTKTIENKEVKVRFTKKGKDLWQSALPVLQNPIKKTYYLEYPPRTDAAYYTKFTALAHYTNLAENNKKYFAIAPKDFGLLKEKKQIKIVPADGYEIYLDVWKYDPGILAENRMVDPLSLYLTLREEKDERVEMELENMIERLW